MLGKRYLVPVLLVGVVLACISALTETARSKPLLLAASAIPIDPPELRLLLDKISTSQGLIVSLQRELVARPAIPPDFGGTGEEEKARWIEGWLNEQGLVSQRLDLADERVPAKVRPNFIARYPEPQAGPTLWLLSHLDVAAPGPRDLWKGDPFALRVDGDVMRGRGVEDNNQAIAVSLVLVDALRKTGVTPPMRLGLVMTSAALTDYSGIAHLLSKKPDLFAPQDLIMVMDYGNAEGSLVNVGEKGSLWLKVTVTGKAGHASNPGNAHNAYAAAAALTHGLQDLERQFTVENPLFTPPRTTIAPTRTEDFSTGVNHIPAKFVFYADARITDAYSFEQVEEGIRKLADRVEAEHGVRVDIQRIDSTPPTRVTSLEAPVLLALDRAIRRQLGVEPQYIGAGSVTVAATLRQAGLPAAVWGVQKTMHNAPEEYALISAHIKQAQVLARMLFDERVARIAGSGGKVVQ